MNINGFIFDLDGVIVSTDEQHYLAWRELARQENISYSKEINLLQRGVSRMESLEVMLKNSDKVYSEAQKREMAERKNCLYVNFIKGVKPSDLLEGVLCFLNSAKERGISCAIGSSSRNAMTILKAVKLDNFFDAVVDGTKIKKSKPDPEVFLLAANLLGLQPGECVVFEDAYAGIEAAHSAGMKTVALGAARDNEKADIRIESLSLTTVDQILHLCNE